METAIYSEDQLVIMLEDISHKLVRAVAERLLATLKENYIAPYVYQASRKRTLGESVPIMSGPNAGKMRVVDWVYERTYDFLDAWSTIYSITGSDGLSGEIHSSPSKMNSNSKKWQHSSQISGDSRNGLAAILNTNDKGLSGNSTSGLDWNERETDYWTAFERDFDKLAATFTDEEARRLGLII